MPSQNTGEDAQKIQQEIQHAQQELVEAYKSLNAINPIAENRPPVVIMNGMNGVNDTNGTGIPDPSSTATTSNGLPLEPLQNLLKQPALQKYVRLISNPQFSLDFSAVLQHPKLHQVPFWELGWLLMIMVLRSWRYSKSKHWFRNFWIFIWTTCLFWVGLLVLIPHFVLGPSFDQLVKDSYRILSEKN